MKKILAFIIVLAVGMVVGWFSHSLATKPRGTEADTTRTTVVDTVTCYYPVAKDSVVTKYVYCKLPLAVPSEKPLATVADTAAWESAAMDADTTKLFCGAGAGGLPYSCDSATVVVPIEQKVYEDSTYKAWISGYMVSLDRIDVYERSTMIRIREEKPPNRFGLGVTAGYGYGKGGFTPFIGVGLTYNIIPLRRIRKAH